MEEVMILREIVERLTGTIDLSKVKPFPGLEKLLYWKKIKEEPTTLGDIVYVFSNNYEEGVDVEEFTKYGITYLDGEELEIDPEELVYLSEEEHKQWKDYREKERAKPKVVTHPQVPPCGPKDAKIVLVGEAPGESEEKSGIPFVGSSGRLLRQLMQSAGISAANSYFTNVVKERPPKNDISGFIDLSKKGAPIINERYTEYEQMLKIELGQLKPNVIVAVGGVALWALCKLKYVSKRRGSLLDCTLVPGIKVIPIIHPASALKNYLFTYNIAFDLQRAAEVSATVERDGNTKALEPRYNMGLKPTYQEALSFMTLLQTKDFISCDIEVSRGEVDCISFAFQEEDKSYTSVCIPFISKGGEVYTLEQETQLLCLIAFVLENPRITKLFQNGSFDCTFLYLRYGIRVKNIEDTMIAQGLLSPGFPKGLDFITSIYTYQTYYKDEGKMYNRILDGYEEERWWRYNSLDSLVLLEAFEKQKVDLIRYKLEATYRSHCELIPILVFLQANGIAMDVEKLRARSKEVGEKLIELEENFVRMTGVPGLNTSSPKQLANYFYVTKGIKPYTSRTTGNVTTDEEALKKMSVAGHIEATVLLTIRKLGKLKSTYLDVTLSDDNRMRCSMNPIGTTTGRLASSKTIFGEGSNMQNQPPEMLRYMLLDSGYIGYAPDLAGAENRVVANCGPVPAMKDAFDRNLDVHRLTASLLFNIPYEEVSDAEGSAPHIGDGTKSMRQWGKMMNHSSNYGIGPIQLASKLEIPIPHAKILLTKYHDRYPEVRFGYQTQIAQMLKNDRRVWNPFGRSRKFFDRYGDPLLQDAYAFFPQSTIADIINRWGLLPMWKEPIFEDCIIYNQIHDSIVFGLPSSLGWQRHAEILSALRTSLEQQISWRAVTFKIPVDFKMSVTTLGNTGKLKELSPENLQSVFEKLSA
jgi:uracil-DNA glycosylase family 4